MTDTSEYAEWAGRLKSAAKGMLKHPTGILGEVHRNTAAETVAQFEAWMDARKPAERGFPVGYDDETRDLPGLAS